MNVKYSVRTRWSVREKQGDSGAPDENVEKEAVCRFRRVCDVHMKWH